MVTIDGFAEPTRAELIERIEENYATWDRLVARAADRLTEPFAGEWSLRDVTAHLCAHERFLLVPMGGRARPVPEMPSDIGASVQRRNEFLHEHDRARSVDAVMDEAAAVRAELLARIGSLPEEKLSAPRFFPWHEWPLWRWLLHLTVEHYDEHRPALRAFVGE
jgi:hypothetical protein